nr:MAG TPA: hypothetical protein [Caudoviricetes sp.]
MFKFPLARSFCVFLHRVGLAPRRGALFVVQDVHPPPGNRADSRPHLRPNALFTVVESTLVLLRQIPSFTCCPLEI